MKEHMKLRELICRYLDNEVTAEERMIVEQALEQSAELRKYYEEQKRLAQVLQASPLEGLSVDWEHKILNSLTKGATTEELQMKKQFNWQLAGAVVVVIIVGVSSLHLYAQRTIQARIRDASQYLSQMSSTPIAMGRLKSASNDIGDQYSSGNTSQSATTGKPAAFQLAATISAKQAVVSDRLRRAGGSQTSQYSVAMAKLSTPLKEQSSVSSVAFTKRTDQYEPYYLDSSYTVVRAQEANMLAIVSLPDQSWRYNDNFNTENYAAVNENQFTDVKNTPVSTFSIDVDTASYSNVRRFLNNNQLPPPDAVRLEEMINYFSYSYPQPTGDAPFSITTKGAVCPWNPAHSLVLVGLQGKTLEADKLPATNLVFLIDVSGSMADANKLPLLKDALKMMVNQLTANERVAIVVYAGSAGEVLESTPGNNKQKILTAIDHLQSGGSTAGGEGIKLAYEIAANNFIKGGNNRVILATDGDFNIGASSDAEMTRLIEEKRKSGVFLTVLGFGMGNTKDSKMEILADKGNGGYYYIDTEREARKVLVSELGSTLFTIAKDVKIQVEFNPSEVKGYRLIGYENRLLAKEDFNDDTKDAGELGAGHTVTALYEIIPADSKEEVRKADDLVYQQAQIVKSDDLMTIKLRYKEPDGEVSKLLSQTLKSAAIKATTLDEDFQFATAVAEFGLLLKNSEFKGSASYDQVLTRAQAAKGKDPFGYRAEFINLVEKAKAMDNRVYTKPGINFKGQQN